MNKAVQKFILLATLLTSFQTLAIDETESLRQRSQDRDSYTNISFDLAGKGGNSKTEDFELGLYHSIRKGNHFGFVMATREYATSFDVESANNSFAHIRYNYYYQEDESIEVFSQLNEDEFRSLESRKLFGLAYRKELSKAQAFGLGLFSEHEDYMVNNQRQKFDQTRVNAYWVYSEQLTKTSYIANTLYYQPNISELSDFRAYNKLSLNTEVTENIYLTFSLLVEHDSKPVLDVKKTDHSYSAGFAVEF